MTEMWGGIEIAQQIDITKPGLARMYDYMLGGTANFESDRRIIDQIAVADPGVFASARENRQFLVRAVRFLAQEAGIRQFLDIGSGLPTQRNVHDVAAEAVPDAHVVYVDNDPVVAVYGRALLDATENVACISGDLRQPDEILSNEAVRGLIDFSRPVALLLVAMLHFVLDDEGVFESVARLVDALPSGSYVVLSHVTLEKAPALLGVAEEAFRDNDMAGNGARPLSEISRFLDGLEILPPGLVKTREWRPDNDSGGETGLMDIYAAMAYKA
jgi:hypothetical protein